jgi:hypothetical protein
VANKLEPGSALLEDIRFKLGGGIAMGDDGHARRVPPDRVLPLPHVRREDDGARLEALIATPEAAALRRALADDVARGPALKRQALAGALEFLDHRLDDLLAPLKAEVTVAEQWALTVARTSEREFYDRHRRHYLNDEKYVDFNHTLVKLMDKLEIPGIGPYISSLSKGIKSVSRFVVGGVVNLARAALGRPNPKLGRPPEEEVVIDAFERWYDALKAEAQLHAASGGHPAWAVIARKLGSHKFYGSFVGDLGAAYQGYRERMDRITAERAQAIYEVIATRPRLLNMLRGVKATLDVGTTGLIVASHGLDWTDAVIAPLVAPVQRLILEFGLQKVLDAERARLKAQQVAAFRDVIDERMIRPVRELFRGAVRPEDLHAARRDLETLRDALSVAGGMGR